MEQENHQQKNENYSPVNKEVVFRNNDLAQNDTRLNENNSLLDQEKIKWKNRFEEFENFYNNAPCGYHTWDENGLILKMNQTELNWLGYTRDEVVNKLYISDLIAEKDVSIIYRSLPILREGKSVDQVELEYEGKNGKFIYALVSAKAMFDDKGNLKCVNTTVWNITERKKMENEMMVATRQKHHLNERSKEEAAIAHKLDQVEKLGAKHKYWLAGIKRTVYP